MPRLPINYQKGVIYFVFHNNILIYIGSTTEFTKRKCSHKRDMKYNFIYFYIYCNENNILFEDLRWECEDFPCNSKNELFKQEGLKIREFNPICNKNISGRSLKERYDDNIEKMRLYEKEYREKNKEKIEEKLTKEINCECGSKFKYRGKSQHLKTTKHINFINANIMN
jgi:hypothetical protein